MGLLEGGGKDRRVSPKLRRHFDSGKRSKKLHTIYTECYSGYLTARGDQAEKDL